MTISSILLGLALVIVVGLYLARPLLQRPHSFTRSQSKRQQLLNQKEAVLTQILALDFDYETGKLPETVYQHQRAEMVAEAAVILEQIDQLPAQDPLDAQIETAVAQLRGQVGPPESTPAAAPVSAANGHSRFCSQCGTAVDSGDKFCSRCGSPLRVPTAKAIS